MYISLNARLDATGDALEQLHLQHSTLRSDCDALHQAVEDLRLATVTVRAGTSSCSDAIRSDEVKELAKGVQQLASQQQHIVHSSEITIGGLSVDSFNDLRRAAFAVISSLVPEISLEHILLVRPLRSVSLFSTATSSSVPEVNGSLPISASNSAHYSATNATKTVSILVTLSNSTLARIVISATIKEKKLHIA